MSGATPGKPVIGLVGGIGAGKSTVAAELARLGCVCVDADAIGHELLGEPDVRREIRERWGGGVFGPDGRVDRARLGRIVFAGRQELAALEGILHPRIRRRLAERIAAARDKAGVEAIVLDAAVLFEAGWNDLCTHIVYVKAGRHERARRVREQRGWERSTLQAREKMQICLDKKAAESDYTIDNSSSASRLREQVRRLIQLIRAADRTG